MPEGTGSIQVPSPGFLQSVETSSQTHRRLWTLTLTAAQLLLERPEHTFAALQGQSVPGCFPGFSVLCAVRRAASSHCSRRERVLSTWFLSSAIVLSKTL